MKKVINKVVDICKLIFGYGIMFVLFSGGITFFGYLFALIIGGEKATNLCNLIFKTFIPVIVYSSTILILFGLIIMYMSGEKALTASNKKKS